jgi:hypothetical protein
MELNMPTKDYYWRHREECIAKATVYHQENPDRANQATRKWAKKNRPYLRATRQAWLAKNPRYEADWVAADRVKNPVRYIFRNAKNRAKALGIEFSITTADIVVPTHCPVLGIELKYSRGERGFGANASPSIDRFNNDKGYTPDNICIISNRANLLKRDGTLDEFRKIVAYMERGLS